MARRGYSNVASPLTTVGSLNNTDLSSMVTVATSPSGWPTVPFFAVLDRATNSEELVYVTAAAGSVFTVTRGGSLATTYGAVTRTHASGVAFEHVAGAADYDEANAHVSLAVDTAPTNIHHTLGTTAYQAAAGNHGHLVGQSNGPASSASGTFNGGVALHTLTAAVVSGRMYQLVGSGGVQLSFSSGSSYYFYATASAGTIGGAGGLSSIMGGGSLLTGATGVIDCPGSAFYTASTTGNVTFTVLVAGSGTGSYTLTANDLVLTLLDIGT